MFNDYWHGSIKKKINVKTKVWIFATEMPFPVCKTLPSPNHPIKQQRKHDMSTCHGMRPHNFCNRQVPSSVRTTVTVRNSMGHRPPRGSHTMASTWPKWQEIFHLSATEAATGHTQRESVRAMEVLYNLSLKCLIGDSDMNPLIKLI